MALCQSDCCCVDASVEHKNLLKKKGKKISETCYQQWMRSLLDILGVYLNLYDAVVTINISFNIGINIGIDVTITSWKQVKILLLILVFDLSY